MSKTSSAPVLSVSKSVTIDASPDRVWETVSRFDALESWHPAVRRTEIISGKSQSAGAVRRLTLGDGGTIREELLAMYPARRRFRYAILDGVLPVSAYESSVHVDELDEHTTKVTWSGTFKRKDQGPQPAEGADDATATGTMAAVYQAGLDNLKSIFARK